MGEKDAWKKERSEAPALETSYGGGYGRNVLNIKCWVNLDLDKVKSKWMNLGEFYCLLPNSPSFDDSFHILRVHAANSNFVKGSVYGERRDLPLLSHIYSNYAHNSREVVKMIAWKEKKGSLKLRYNCAALHQVFTASSGL